MQFEILDSIYATMLIVMKNIPLINKYFLAARFEATIHTKPTEELECIIVIIVANKQHHIPVVMAS